MKIEIPKYNYTEEQLDELTAIIHEFQYEFDIPENREKFNQIIMSKVNDYISENRESKINQIIKDGTT